MPRDRLTLRQQTFAELYVTLRGNGARAARQAGYGGSPERRAYENLRQPLIQAEIERIRQKQQGLAAFTVEWWRRELLNTYVEADATGDRSAALKALELAGKHLGLLDTRAASGDVELAAKLLSLLAAAGRPGTYAVIEGEHRELGLADGNGAAPKS